MEVEDGALARVVDLLGCSPQEARFLLEAAGGANVEAAVQMFYDQMGAAQAPPRAVRGAGVAQTGGEAAPLAALPPRPRPRTHSARQGSTTATSVPARGPPVGWLPNAVGMAVRLPFLVVRTSLGIALAGVGMGLGIAAMVGDRVLPVPIMRAARGIAATVVGANDLVPQEQAERFIQQFKATYGDRHPRWVATELQAACITARSSHKFLMVYLHSPEHQDTRQFCRDVLCDPDLVTYVNEQFVCWGGDIHRSDAHALSLRLGATTYPFVAVLSMAGGSRATLIKASQGRAIMEPGALLALLRRCMDEQGALLVAQRVEQQERETTRQLLEQQNAEYEASLAADRAREAARAAERAAAEQAAREAAEAEARVRAAREAAERRRAERAAAITTRRAAKREAVQGWAAVGDGGQACQLRLRLPDGSTAQTALPATGTVSRLFDFADSLDGINCWKYNLVSNYPRKVFTRDEASAEVSLQTAGLVPHAALFVQPLDVEEDEEEGLGSALEPGAAGGPAA